MANIDSLQINISMANKNVINNIEDIISALGRLEKAMAVTTSAKEYKAGLNSVADGFLKLGEAVQSIDVSSIKNVTSALGSLSNQMAKISNPVSNIGKSLKLDEKTKANIDEWKYVIELYKDQIKELQSITVGSSKYARAEAGDDWRKLNGYGKNIGKSKNNYGLNPEARDIYRRTVGGELSDNDDEAIVQYEKKIYELKERVKDARKEIEKLKSSAMESRSVISAIFDDDAYATEDMFGTDKVVEKSQELQSANVGQTISNIASGLSELQGISIPAGQFAGINEFSSAVSKLAPINGDNIESVISGIGRGISQLSTAEMPNVETLTTVVNAISKFGRGSVQNAGASVTSIATGLKELVPATEEANNINIESLAGISNALKEFGRANVGHAAEYLPQLAVSMRSLMETMATAPEVSDKTLRLAEAMAQFSQRAASVTNASKSVSRGFNLIGNSAHINHRKIVSLAAIFGRLYANFFLLIRGARLIGKAINYSSQMTEAMNVVDVAFGKANGKLTDFLETSIKDFGLGRLAAAQYASRFQAMGKTLGITAEEVGKANDFILKKTEGNALAYKDLGDSVADMSINLTKLTADMASLYNQDYDDVAADMQAVYTGMTRPLRKYGLDLTQATLKEWALANGLNADIEKMTQAEKTLLRYQYVMSNASIAMGDFTKTADTWANTMRTTKQLIQEFGRMLGEAFINTFKPALIAFRNFMYNMLHLTESTLNAIGSLLGWAKIDFGGAALSEEMDDFADSLDDAAGSAKKLNAQLRPIDELNNLTTNNGGGGGGSGILSELGYDGNSIWDNIKETQEKYLSDIESWKELGTRIAEKIGDALRNIDWEVIKEKAKQAWHNFAEFLNGLLNPETFYQVGRTIAEMLNTGIGSALEFALTLDWENIGTTIGNGLNGFVENFNFAQLGKAIKTFIKGLWKMFKAAFLDTFDWSKLWEGLIDFFKNGVDLDTISIVLGALTLKKGIGFAVELSEEIIKAIAKKIATTEIAVDSLTIVTSGAAGGAAGAAGGAAGGAAAGGTVTLGQAILGVIVAALGGYHIGNGLMQIIAAISGNDEMLGDYQDANIFTNDSAVSDVTYKMFELLVSDNKDLRSAKEQAELNKRIKEWKFDNHGISDEVVNALSQFYRDNGYSNAAMDYTNFMDYGTVPEYWTTDILNMMKSYKSRYSDIILGEENHERWISIVNQLSAVDDEINLVNKSFEKLLATSDKSFGQVLADALGLKNGFSKDIDSIIKDIQSGNINIESMGSTFGEMAEALKTADIETILPFFKDTRWQNFYTVISKNLSYEQFLKIGENMGSGMGTSFARAMSKIEAAYAQIREEISKNPLDINMNVIANIIKNTFDNVVTSLKEYDATQNKTGMPSYVQEALTTGTTPKVNTTPTNTKTRIKNPHYSNAAAQEAWEKAHPKSLYEWYAQGGFPSIGSLFFAGEAGSELVGNINGKTGVASNMEITGIRDAIMQTSSEEVVLLRQQNTLLQQILEKEFGISGDALFRSVRNSAADYKMRTGRVAF